MSWRWLAAVAETWMDLEIIILNEVSQTKTKITLYHLYAESKKNDTKKPKWIVYKTEIDPQIENKPIITKGHGGGIS